MTKPRGQPRVYPAVRCPKCHKKVGANYLVKHLKRCKG